MYVETLVETLRFIGWAMVLYGVIGIICEFYGYLKG